MNQQNPTVDTFFDNTGGGVGAPSAKLSDLNDFIYGEVVDQAMVPKKKFGTDEVEKDARTGEPINQLAVIVQTDLRNWQSVAKVPKNEDGSPKAPSEDDGRRAVYVAPFTNIHAAIGTAIIAGTGQKGPIRNGATLGIKIVELRDTNKGNPLKVHEAVYNPPTPGGAEFFGDQNTAQQAPVSQPVQQAAPAQQATPQQAFQPPVQQTQAPAPQVDPWSGQAAAPAQNKPPF